VLRRAARFLLYDFDDAVLFPDSTSGKRRSLTRWLRFFARQGIPAEVARVNRDGEELKFQWTETPRGVPADALKCALLLVDLDGLDHGIALMTPQTVEPFTIELDKPSLRQQISLEAPVESDQIKVEIVKADGVGKTLIDPPEPVPGNTPIKLAVVRNDRHNNDSEGVIYRVKATLRRDRLMMQADLVAPTPSVFVQTFQQLTSNREMIEKQKKQLEEQFKKSRGGPREQARLALDQIDAGMWYADFFGKVHEKAEIHYRIFMEVAGRQIDLVVTKSAE